MHKAGIEESADRVEWAEMSVRGDFWWEDSSKSEKEGLQDDS